MDDLIRRQAAIDAINRYGSVWMEYTEDMSVDEIAERALKASKQSMVKILHDLPSVHPEIIKCKDCKHYYYADNRIPQEQRYSCDLDGDRWKPEDFCSYAERKDNG